MLKKLLIIIAAWLLMANIAAAQTPTCDCSTPTPSGITLPITPVQTTVAQGNVWISATRNDIATYNSLTASLPLTLSGYLTDVSNVNMPLRYLSGFQITLNDKIPLLGAVFSLFILIIQWRFLVIIVKFIAENANSIKDLILDAWGALPFT